MPGTDGKPQVTLLEGENATLRQKVDKLLAENEELKEKLANFVTEDQFVIHEGFALKRGENGKFEPTGYCPNCKSVMSNMGVRSYQCPKCKYLHRCRFIPEVLANQLNAKSE